MRPPDELSPEAHAAIVECLKVAARRGRQLRLEREARECAAREMASCAEFFENNAAAKTDEAMDQTKFVAETSDNNDAVR